MVVPTEVLLHHVAPFLSGADQEILCASSAALYHQRRSETLASLPTDFAKEPLSLAQLQSLKFFQLFQACLASPNEAKIEQLKGFINCMSAHSRVLVMDRIPLLSNKPTLPDGAVDHLVDMIEERRAYRGC